MSKNNIAQQYNSMVASIEDAKIYDGRGEYNLYECNKCNNYKVTLYKDKGVTPFIMRCKCGGDMMHTKSSPIGVNGVLFLKKKEKSHLIWILRK